MTELLALDLGNKQVKGKSSKKEYRMPSHFMSNISNSSINNDFAIGKSKKRIVELQKVGDDFSYSWGEDIDSLENQEDGMLETMEDGAARYNDMAFKLLVDFSLALLARDFKESHDNVLHANVVTGLPTKDYSDQNCVDNLVKAIKGQHSVIIDNKQTINVQVDHVTILPQPVGTVFDAVTTDNLDNLTDELINVVDCGGGTLLIDTLNSLKYSKNDTRQTFTGVHTLYKSIIQNIHDPQPTEYEIENIIRKGIANNNKFIYVINKDDKRDITSWVNQCIRMYTLNVINKIKHTVTNMVKIDDIIFTGGGSAILDHEMIKNAFPKAIFANHGEMTNVNGFYSYGEEYFE